MRQNKHNNVALARIASWLLIVDGAVLLVCAFLWAIGFRPVCTDFATKAYLKYHYAGKKIDVKIGDKDLATLKGMLKGFSYSDSPACGFGEDVSITLTDGQNSITFCPACDTCAKFQIGNSHRYISVSEKQRKCFDAIVKKYGMTFPCV